MRIIKIILFLLCSNLLNAQINGGFSFGGSSTSWNTSPKYTPKVKDMPFEYGVNWGGDSITMYIDTQFLAGQPLYGAKMQIYSGDWIYGTGAEYNPFNGEYQSFLAVLNPNTFKSNTIVIDTNEVAINYSATGTGSKVILNDNGLRVPVKAVEPIGQNGAIYYNTALTPPRMRVYENGAWRDL